MEFSTNSHLMEGDETPVNSSAESCSNEPSNHHYLRETSARQRENIGTCEVSSNSVSANEKNDINEVSVNIDKSMRTVSPNRRCRRRADLPPDVLAKVREKDKERKRLTRVRKRINAISGCCSQFLYPNENCLNAYNPSVNNEQLKASTNTSNDNSNNCNDWNMKTAAMNINNGSNRSENGCEVEDNGKTNSLSVHEYLIKQTLTAEQTKTINSEVDPKNTQISNFGDNNYNDNTYYYYNDHNNINVSLSSLSAQPSNAVYNDLATAPNGCGGDSNNAPLILTKISGFEVINVAADYNNVGISHNLNGGVANFSNELKLQSNDGEINGGESMNLLANGGEVNEQVKDNIANNAAEGNNISSEKDELANMTCLNDNDKNDEKQSVKKVRRRASRSRSVLPPEKLAFIRAIDAERKRIARTRSRLLKMKNRMTADNKSIGNNNDNDARKSRLLRRRKHAVSVEDATKYGWPQLNDERKERTVLQRRFEKYRIIIEKMIDNEKEMCGGEVPLEILRAMVVEQAKFFSFLTQRSDSRCGRLHLGQPSDNITTTATVIPNQQSSEPIS